MKSPAAWNLPTHLAWSQLMRERRRLAAALAGVAFAVILMLMQLGFRDALYTSATEVHSHVRADLVMVSSQYDYLGDEKSFSQRRLYQALGFDGVESVVPLYIGVGKWKNPQDGSERAIFVLGFNPQTPALNLPNAEAQTPLLMRPDVVLFDSLSRPEFGPVPANFQRDGEFATEIEGHAVRVGGLFQLGTSFAADGNVLASDTCFLRLFPNRQAGLIDLGLVRLRPGVDPETVRRQMVSSLPAEIKLLTVPQFMDLENSYWATSTPIGFVFTLGTLLGLVVGFVVVYQILYTDVMDHLPEYATLKAIGYADQQLGAVVRRQALFVSVLGFVPAWAVTWGLYIITWRATNLPIAMSFSRTMIVFVLTVIMCAASGALAMRKLKAADPADIF